MPGQIAEVLKQAIQDSGLSAIALSKEVGVPQSIISRFLRGETIRLDTAQKLADHFGIVAAVKVAKANPTKPIEVTVETGKSK